MRPLTLGHHLEEIFEVKADVIATGRTCVIGTSGSGKSYTVGTICEELCKTHVPFAIIDVEGEYSGLREKYEVLWIGEDESCDLKWNGLNLQELSRNAPKTVPLILDVSELENPRDKIQTLLSGIYREISLERTPYLIILEEADRFSPQIGDRVKIFDEIARRGRKRGLGLMICTQRPSLVDKNLLSQCGNQFIGKLTIKNDLQSVSQFFPGRGLPEQLTSLNPGIFYVLGGLSTTPVPIEIRKRETSHGGITPKLTDRIVIPSKEIIEKVQSRKIEAIQVGLPPLISSREIPSIIKKGRRFLLFRTNEVVNVVTLNLRPILEVGVRIRTGVVRKKFETVFFTLDGVTGDRVEFTDRLVLKKGFRRLLGLNTLQMEVLRNLSPTKDLSLIEVAGRIDMQEDILRKPMKVLEDKRLIRSSKIGRIRMFRRLVDIPRIRFMKQFTNVEEINELNSKMNLTEIKETDVREIVKGIADGYDVDAIKTFFYPLYLVELVLKNKARRMWLDGRTGVTVNL